MVIFCTEVLEVYEAADTVRVASEGQLSRPLSIKGYSHVEHLASDIIQLEGAPRDKAAV